MLDVLALRHAMLDANCSASALAKACEISPSALYRRMCGDVPFNLKEITRCCDRLNLNPERRDEIFFAPEFTKS